MFPQLYTAASGMLSGERKLEVTANNLANTDTPGFKSERPLFSSYLAEEPQRAAGGAKVAAPVSVAVTGAWRAFEPGALRPTGNPLDLALETDGFFRVQTPQGERLTRNGQFSLDNDGRIVTAEKFPLLDDAGQPIVLGNGKLVVGQDGSLTIDGRREGQLGIVSAAQSALIRDGETNWRATAATTPIDPSELKVRQAHIESSNVNANEEVAGLINAQRLFELQQRLVDVTANQLARRAIDLGEAR